MSVDLSVLEASIKKMEDSGREDKAEQLRKLKEKIIETQAKLDSNLKGLKPKGMFRTSCCRRKKKKTKNRE